MTYTATQRQRRRRPTLSGASIAGIAVTRVNGPRPGVGAKGGVMPRYPRRARLDPTQLEALALVSIRPRDTAEVAKALAIEFPTAQWALETLRKRGHVEMVAGRPVTWRPADGA